MSVVAWQIFPKKLQNVWEEWNLRVAVLLSLTCQVILIFVGSARKRSGSLLINSFVWSSYLIADWIAAFAVGLISNSQGEKCEKATVDDALAAFWAPFLLLHLGGPDTITAFSLEDNELWLRHMLNVVAQVFAVGYVFLQSQPNTFWLPTGLVCLAGTIKYAERTRSLYLACLGNLKDSLRPNPDPGPNYAQLMEEYSSNRAAGVPEEIHRVPEPPKKAAEDSSNIKEEERIQYAYTFYDKFRGLIVDHMFSFHERNESREFFFSQEATAAFRLMEVELNFLYDALYTKMAAVHNGVFPYILRFVCSALLVATFVLFASHHKPHIHPFDRNVTYALLAGAIVLDFVALVKVVFSDWTIALVKHSRALSDLGLQSLLLKLNVPAATLAVRRVMSFRRRWSNCMCQHNLIRYCLKKRYKLVDKTAEHFAMKELLDKFLSRKQEKVDDSLKKFIFDELKEKAKKAEDTKFAKNIYSARGEWTLPDDYDTLVLESVSEEVEYDESVLMWHIATDICYYKNQNNCCYNNQNNKSAEENRTRCKHLSDYMLYLLIMQPKLMLSVTGIASIRFQDTCAEARKFFARFREKMKEEDACDKLINVETPVEPVEVKGDRSKSLLFDAVRLAKKLNEKVREKPGEAWETMSKVWLELLCYGASHCRGDAHAQQIRQGGELITFVWLLMSHFGLGEQFRIDAGHARAKLVVEK